MSTIWQSVDVDSIFGDVDSIFGFGSRFLAREVDFWLWRIFLAKNGVFEVFLLNFGFRVESGLGNLESLWVFF